MVLFTIMLVHVIAVWKSTKASSQAKIWGVLPPLFPFPSLPLPFCSLFSSPLALPLEVGPLNAARGSGGCCKLSQQGLGQSPNQKQIWFILALKPDISSGFGYHLVVVFGYARLKTRQKPTLNLFALYSLNITFRSDFWSSRSLVCCRHRY